MVFLVLNGINGFKTRNLSSIELKKKRNLGNSCLDEQYPVLTHES